MLLFDMSTEYDSKTGHTEQPAYDFRQYLRSLGYDSVYDRQDWKWFDYTRQLWVAVYGYEREVAFIVGELSLSRKGVLNPVLIQLLVRGKSVRLYYALGDYDQDYCLLKGVDVSPELQAEYAAADACYTEHKAAFQRRSDLEKFFKNFNESLSAAWIKWQDSIVQMHHAEYCKTEKNCTTCAHNSDGRYYRPNAARYCCDSHKQYKLPAMFRYTHEMLWESYKELLLSYETMLTEYQDLMWTHGLVFKYKDNLDDSDNQAVAKAKAYDAIDFGRDWLQRSIKGIFYEDMNVSTYMECIGLLKVVFPEVYKEIDLTVRELEDTSLDESPLTSGKYVLSYFERTTNKSMVYALARAYDLDMYRWYQESAPTKFKEDPNTVEAQASPSFKPGVYTSTKKVYYPDSLSWITAYLYVRYMWQTKPKSFRPPYVWVETEEVATTRKIYPKLEDDYLDDDPKDYGSVSAQPAEIQFFNNKAYRLAEFGSEVRNDRSLKWVIIPE